MNLREHVMEKIAGVEVTVPAGELLELLDERDALKDRVSSLEFRLGFGVSGPPKVETEHHANGSITGGWDIQDGDELETVNLRPSEQCAVDAILVQVSESGEITGPVEMLAKDIERAVCGDRQPPSQEAELTPEIPALKPKPFTADKGAGNPSENVSPWRAKYVPNQCRLVLQMLAEGAHRVTIAANARVTPEAVHDIAKAYKVQLGHMEDMTDKEREHYLDSVYRQMLARWVAAGNLPGIQTEAPLPNKTPSKASRYSK